MTELDHSALERGAGLAGRLRSLGGSPRFVVATTMAVIMLLGGIAAALASFLVPAEIEWGGVLCAALLLVMGTWVLIDVLRRAGDGARLETFARVNDLELIQSVAVPDYAGSLFRSGKRVVEESVRTRTMPLLEVGDSWPTERVRIRRSSTGMVSAANPPEAHGFLRIVLPAGELPPREQFPVPWELDEALTELLGAFSLELHERELTVMGSTALDLSAPGSVTAALDVAARLARHAQRMLPSGTRLSPGAPVPDPGGSSAGRRSRHPVAIAGAVVGILLVLPLAFAIVMSILDDLPLDGWMVGAAIQLLILAATVAFALLLRWAWAGRRRSRRKSAASGPARGARAEPHSEHDRGRR